MSMTNSNNIQLESQEHFNLNEQTDPSLLSLTEWVQLKRKLPTNYILTYIKDYKKRKNLLKMCSLLISDNFRTNHWNSQLLKGRAQPTLNQNLEKTRFFQRRSEILIQSPSNKNNQIWFWVAASLVN